MAFKEFPGQPAGVELLQRSLDRGRLAHGYLFSGHQLDELEGLARTLAKTLNCLQPVRGKSGQAIDSCDACLNCRKIEHGNHADVHWARPESKSRVITVDQVRQLMRQMQLKPTEAAFKLGIVVAADRLRIEAANAFLKTLEEPPAQCVLILVTTEPQRMLETIVSRCLRINLGGDGVPRLSADQLSWLGQFGEMAATQPASLLGRYRLLDVLLGKLTSMKAAIDDGLTARSPLELYQDAEKDLRDQWETELAAGIEAEYRRQRADLLQIVQWWFRDVWLQALAEQSPGNPKAAANGPVLRPDKLLCFPQLSFTRTIAQRLSPGQARENLHTLEQLQRRLHTNVQEALALEVGLLRLNL